MFQRSCVTCFHELIGVMFNRASSTTSKETRFAREPGRKMRRWILKFMWGGKEASTGRRLPWVRRRIAESVCTQRRIIARVRV